MNDLSLILMRHNKNVPAPIIRPHPIQFYELTLLVRGSLCYFLNGTPVQLQPGDAIFVKKGTHRARPVTGEPADYVSFNFQTEAPPALPTHMAGVLEHDVHLILAAADEISSIAETADNTALIHLLQALLLLLIHKQETKKIHPLTDKILQYLKQNTGRRITLSDIGALTYFSPVYCDTVFKRDMGRSIIDHLLEMRVSEAKALLLEGELSLKEIAERTGFGDSNYFSRIFKKRTGYTPLQYRKHTLR
ncbi:MAG: helix-turn-helix domain-containing protein [Ruminococcaceae bacterium]|nr:helix-turn-helix domain-containing protein [Oscillospiraceae bacterium]